MICELIDQFKLAPKSKMQCSRSAPHNKAALAGCQLGLPGVSARGLALNQHSWLYRSPLPCIHCISTASGGLAARASVPGLSHSPYFQLTCLHNSAPSPGPSLQPPGGANDEFAVNFGEAVQVLRQDLPDLFVRDPRFHIFREDLTFRWAHSALQRSQGTAQQQWLVRTGHQQRTVLWSRYGARPVHVARRTPSLRYSTGLWKYRVLHRAARYLGNLLYADMQLNMTRMWQPAGSRQQLR
jgi:hypothetical protein